MLTDVTGATGLTGLTGADPTEINTPQRNIHHNDHVFLANHAAVRNTEVISMQVVPSNRRHTSMKAGAVVATVTPS